MPAVASLRSLLEGVAGVRLLTPSNALEDSGFFTPQSEPEAEDAPTVDGNDFVAHPVGESETSEFTHFLDGAQRTWLAIYDGFVPICLAHTSAALLARHSRELLSPEPDSYSGDLEAFVPSESGIARSVQELVPVVPVSVSEGDTTTKMQEEIANRISARRDEREQGLASVFKEGRLLIDGGISKGVGQDAFVVGLVKSHRKQYFKSKARIQTLLDLKPGQRTSVFHRPESAAQGPAFSFYLKLHEYPHQGPMFGLIRLEIPPKVELLDEVDNIAGWVLRERCPLSMPDGRFDRLLYPIRLVEQHLKARQPSDARIRGIIGV